MCNYFHLFLQDNSGTAAADTSIFLLITRDDIFLDQMHPVGFDIIGLKILLFEALRPVRLSLAGEDGDKGLLSVFCCSQSLLSLGLSCRPAVCSVPKGVFYMHTNCLQGGRNRTFLWNSFCIRNIKRGPVTSVS
jgi:hypothetical protein